MTIFSKAEAAGKTELKQIFKKTPPACSMEFLIVRHGFTVEEMHRRGIPGTTGLHKRHKTVWPAVALYLDELPD